jgi:hypothetical protein
MATIVLEGVLFVALIVTTGALLYLVLMQFTPLGVRVRQVRNRRLIEAAAARVCSIHGPHVETDMILLPSGERLCPECYSEILHD